jgi:hypothetical protein
LVQLPVQAPAEQANGQVLTVCHWPAASHCCVVRPTHCFDPGEQTPVQLPAPEQT